MLVLMLVSLYTTRLLLKVLGIDDYGIFNVVGGLIIMITFISQGLTGAARRYLMAELATGNIQSQRMMFTNVVVAHLLLSIAIIIIAETIGLWYFCNYLNIPASRINAALWVFQLSLLSSIVSIMIAPFDAVIVSEEKMDAYAYFSIIDAILKLVIVWALIVVNGDKLVMYALFLVGVGFVDFLMYYCYCRIKFPLCRLVRTKGSRKIKELYGYMGWTVFGLGANVASRQGVTMLINMFYNVAVNAAIGISNVIVGVASKFVSNFQMAFAPQLTKNYIAGNDLELNYLLNRASRYSSFLVLVVLIPICVVLSDLLEIWLGEYPQYTEEFCVLTLVCIYFDAMSNPLITVITADNNIKQYQILIAGIYLLDFFISWGVLVMGALPYYVLIVKVFMSILGMVVRLILMKKKIKAFSPYLWGKTILGRGITIFILCMPLLMMNQVGLYDSGVWFRFLFAGSISFVWTALIIWNIGLTSNERFFIIGKAKVLVSKVIFHE